MGETKICTTCGSFPHKRDCAKYIEFKRGEVRAAGRIMAGTPTLSDIADALSLPDANHALGKAIAQVSNEHIHTRDGFGWRCSCDHYRRLRSFDNEPPFEHDAAAIASAFDKIVSGL